MRTALFLYLDQRSADFLIAVKNCRRKGFQAIKSRLFRARKAPLHTSKRERGHGREITWTLWGMPAAEWVVENWPGSAKVIAVRRRGSLQGKSIDETRYFVSAQRTSRCDTRLRTGADALLRQVHDRWSVENSWHWPCDTQIKEIAHRYCGVNGVQIIATLRSLAMNALRLDGHWSITEGLAALSHDIRGLLAMLGWRESAQGSGPV